MDYREHADLYVWDFLHGCHISTDEVSDSGTVDNLLNDGWTLTEIINGEADKYILDNACWLEVE